MPDSAGDGPHLGKVPGCSTQTASALPASPGRAEEVTSSADGFGDLACQVGTCKDTPHINQRVHHDIAGHQPLTLDQCLTEGH